jgi:F-type H+-transporting ATPase subunit c
MLVHILGMLPLAVETVTNAGNAVVGNLGVGVGAAGIMIGAGVAVAGAGRGIGNIGGSAVEAIARQPEAKGSIGTNMIIAAALIEGFTFFALVIGILLMGKLG